MPCFLFTALSNYHNVSQSKYCKHCPKRSTYSVGDAVLEAYEFYGILCLFPFRPQREYEVQSGILGVCIVVEQRDVSDGLHGVAMFWPVCTGVGVDSGLNWYDAPDGGTAGEVFKGPEKAQDGKLVTVYWRESGTEGLHQQ